MEFSTVKDGLIHIIELIMLISIIIELLILIKKIIYNDPGKPLMVLILLSTISIRDIMLTIEEIRKINYNVFVTEVVVIFLVFIVVKAKTFFYNKDSIEEN
jgi:hypothetical protein